MKNIFLLVLGTFCSHQLLAESDINFKTSQALSCSNGVSYNKTVRSEGLARVANKVWLKSYLNVALANSQDLIIEKRLCRNMGYVEQNLHSVRFTEYVDNGFVAINAEATFSCCDTDNNPNTAARFTGLTRLNMTTDVCAFHLGRSYKEFNLKETALTNPSPVNNDFWQTKLNHFSNNRREMYQKNISALESIVKLSIESQQKKFLDSCASVAGVPVIFNKTFFRPSRVTSSQDGGYSIENILNPMATMNALCCKKLDVPDGM